MKTPTKEQREKAQAIINQRIKEVQKLVPSGWQVSECMMLDMGTLQSSEPMVTAYRKDKKVNYIKGSTTAEQKELQKRQREIWREEAQAVACILSSRGFEVRRDGASLYIIGRKPVGR